MNKAWKAAPARCRKALWSPKSGKTYRYRYLVSLNLEILPYSRTYPGMPYGTGGPSAPTRRYLVNAALLPGRVPVCSERDTASNTT